MRVIWDRKLLVVRYGRTYELVIRESGRVERRTTYDQRLGPTIDAAALRLRCEPIVLADGHYGDGYSTVAFAYYARGKRYSTGLSYEVERGYRQVTGTPPPPWLEALDREMGELLARV